MEGYDPGDATPEMIMEIPDGVNAEVGWPSDEVLQACGAEIVVDGHTRVVKIGERTFCEGLLESEIRRVDEVIRETYGGEGAPPDDPPSETEH